MTTKEDFVVEVRLSLRRRVYLQGTQTQNLLVLSRSYLPRKVEPRGTLGVGPISSSLVSTYISDYLLFCRRHHRCRDSVYFRVTTRPIKGDRQTYGLYLRICNILTYKT